MLVKCDNYYYYYRCWHVNEKIKVGTLHFLSSFCNVIQWSNLKVIELLLFSITRNVIILLKSIIIQYHNRWVFSYFHWQTNRTWSCPDPSSSPAKRTRLRWRVRCTLSPRQKSRGKRNKLPATNRRGSRWSPTVPIADSKCPGQSARRRARQTPVRHRLDPNTCWKWNRCRDRKTLDGTVARPKTRRVSLTRKL